ncbi:hypothetical protein [Rugamonas aquatica]|uniref:Uncharacterized protein n=1 Tax=Rugamonas aquatica TaxID=2743357 RepID=A0A6A7N6P7_9BURK|nr:hypothetical protein [Rugamonas aquatica]MQA40753.1 hypothetical protein [Rugamonas aquatica]
MGLTISSRGSMPFQIRSTSVPTGQAQTELVSAFQHGDAGTSIFGRKSDLLVPKPVGGKRGGKVTQAAPPSSAEVREKKQRSEAKRNALQGAKTIVQALKWTVGLALSSVLTPLGVLVGLLVGAVALPFGDLSVMEKTVPFGAKVGLAPYEGLAKLESYIAGHLKSATTDGDNGAVPTETAK